MNQTSIAAAEVLSDYVGTSEPGRCTLDIDFGAGVTGTVKVYSRPFGGIAKPLVFAAANEDAGDMTVTKSSAIEVPANREYAIYATAKGGDAGLITLTLNQTE